MAEEYKKGFNYRDEEIEYLNRNAGFELEMTREEKTLFSIGSDLDWGLIKEFVHGQK